jgi:protein-S-isoprenylcysteine O-methyltransferase Ste14
MSLSGLQTGIALMANSVWVLVMLVPTLMIIHRGVILREERYLEKKFGTEYANYRESVRRWL